MAGVWSEDWSIKAALVIQVLKNNRKDWDGHLVQPSIYYTKKRRIVSIPLAPVIAP